MPPLLAGVLPEEALWVSEHPDLIGDKRLGDEFALRFLPSRFTADAMQSTPKAKERASLHAPLATLRFHAPYFKSPPCSSQS